MSLLAQPGALWLGKIKVSAGMYLRRLFINYKDRFNLWAVDSAMQDNIAQILIEEVVIFMNAGKGHGCA